MKYPTPQSPYQTIALHLEYVLHIRKSIKNSYTEYAVGIYNLDVEANIPKETITKSGLSEEEIAVMRCVSDLLERKSCAVGNGDGSALSCVDSMVVRYVSSAVSLWHHALSLSETSNGGGKEYSSGAQ